MHVKAYHRAARPFVDLNLVYIQRVHGEDIAVRFLLAAPRRRSPLCQSQCASESHRQAEQPDRNRSPAVIRACRRAGLPRSSATSPTRLAHPDRSRSQQNFWFPLVHRPTPDGERYYPLITHPVKHVTFRQLSPSRKSLLMIFIRFPSLLTHSESVTHGVKSRNALKC